MSETKKCINCYQVKPVTEFYLKSQNEFGKKYWQTRCKACNSEVQAGYRHSARFGHLRRGNVIEDDPNAVKPPKKKDPTETEHLYA